MKNRRVEDRNDRRGYLKFGAVLLVSLLTAACANQAPRVATAPVGGGQLQGQDGLVPGGPAAEEDAAVEGTDDPEGAASAFVGPSGAAGGTAKPVRSSVTGPVDRGTGADAPGSPESASSAAGVAPAGTSADSGATPQPSGLPGAGKTIVVGTVDHRTAPFAACQNAYEGGAAFFADLNARGGVNGYKFKYIGYDDGMDPNRNLAATKRLIEQDNVAGLVGYCSDFANSISGPETTKAGIPVIGGVAAPDPAYKSANWFPTISDQQVLYPKIGLQFVKDQLKQTRVGMLYPNVPQGQGGARSARKFAQQLGMTLAFESAFSLVEPDFTSFVVKLKEADVQAVLMIGTADHQIRYLKAAEQQGFGVPVVAPFAAYDLSIGPAVGKFIEDKYYVVLSHAPIENSPPEVAARFTTAMKRYFPKVSINTFTISQWIAGEIFAEAVRRLGDKPPTRENLDRALRALKAWEGSFNGPITFNDSGPNFFPNGCFSLVKGTADRGYLPIAGPRFVCSPSY